MNSSSHSTPTVPVAWRPSAAFPQRQVHLDYHTSPYISDAGVEFDATEFAQTFRRAHVDSVTVFAKCHHGMCYYPTKTGQIHPALGSRDLLGEMIEALHRQGIRAPIYTTVAWEEHVALHHPEWRQLRADGTFARQGNADPTKPAHPGGWWFNDWVNTDYQDYIEAHVREISARYSVDGLFFDIVFYGSEAHHSAAASAARARWGLQDGSRASFQRFEARAQDEFCARFTRLVRGLHPQATVFYNSGLNVTITSDVGARVRHKHMTHFEIESLPSGFWGYYHFPRLARSCGRWTRPWIGMTGRFQKMWGDFGGIKPQPALEYECFRSQALGGGNSVGDQLPPRGRLDRAAYDLIGAVYAQCAAAEPFYAGNTPLRQVGILTANHVGADLNHTNKSDEGAILMAEEAHYEADLLDEEDSFEGYAALILPDSVVIDAKLSARLAEFHAGGGHLVVSHRSGCDEAGRWGLPLLPLEFDGEVEAHPTYWRARNDFWPEMSASDRVVYSKGLKVVPGPGTTVLVDRVAPYFPRTDLTFSSHFQTPPVAQVGPYPAVVRGQGFHYFADPIFREYREVGNTALRDVWKRVMHASIGEAPFGRALPTTVLSVARRRGEDLILTLLHYIPLRKSLELDVLEERMSFADERLHLPSAAVRVVEFGSGRELPRDADGAFILPSVKGRLLLEIPRYFTTATEAMTTAPV